MNNRYFEYNVKPKNENKERFIYKILYILKLVFIILSSIAFFIAFMFDNLFWVIFTILLTATLVTWYFQLKFYNFYDFIFVDGNVSVVKIYNNTRRKNLLKFSVKSIVSIGLIGKGNYVKYHNDKNVKKIYAFNKISSKDLYFLIDNGEKFLLYLPFDEKFLSGVLRYNTQNKLEKELIQLINEKL